jgi:hypothetical protein
MNHGPRLLPPNRFSESLKVSDVGLERKRLVSEFGEQMPPDKPASTSDQNSA